jgi:hypothetical protein
MPLFRRKRDDALSDATDRLLANLDAGGRLPVQCWYCEEQIEYEGFDPCAVVIVANWASDEKPREQQFFAHAACFRNSGSGKELFIFESEIEAE